jgi:hypothetical protein
MAHPKWMMAISFNLHKLQIIGAAGFCERFGLLLLLDTFRYCCRISVFYIQCYCPIGGSL